MRVPWFVSTQPLWGAPWALGVLLLLNGKPWWFSFSSFLGVIYQFLTVDSHFGHGCLITLVNLHLSTQIVYYIQRDQEKGSSLNITTNEGSRRKQLPGNTGDDLISITEEGGQQGAMCLCPSDSLQSRCGNIHYRKRKQLANGHFLL